MSRFRGRGRSRLSALILALLGTTAVACRTTSAGVTSFSNANEIVIPDSGAGSPYPSAIAVSAVKGQLIRLTVTLVGLTHARPEDLDILNGADPDGTWRLFVHDDEAMHSARIAGGWSVTIQTDVRAGPPAVTLVGAGPSRRLGVPILLRPGLAPAVRAATGAARP